MSQQFASDNNAGLCPEALDALGKAMELGYRDIPHLMSDPDLAAVRRDPRFKRLLDRKWGKRTRG